MFEVDPSGLAKILERKGKKFVPLELIQNAFDEDGVTKVDVTIEVSTQHRGYYRLVVEDDAPEGFHDLKHAYTLFAESKKKGVATKRGRWNLGEKLVIAVCRYAQIKTTKGTVTFSDGQRSHSRAHTSAGSIFSGDCRMTHGEAEEAIAAVRSVLVPPTIKLTINGKAVDCRDSIARVTLTLPTETADAEGFMRKTERQTELRVYPVAMGEEPSLFEMGIPVVTLDCDWHVDIAQKVPLNFDRDNVTPAYKRSVLTAVVNLMHTRLDQQTAAKPWVAEALESSDIEPEAVRSIITAKHGEHVVTYDPSDAEGTKIAVTRGYQVLYGGAYSRDQWDNIRRAEVALPAGMVTPSPRPFHPDGTPLKTLDRSQWSEGHIDFEDYVHRVSTALIGRKVDLVLANDPGWGFAGAFGRSRLTVNICGNSHWFKRPISNEVLAEIDRLLVHELSHDEVSDHLSEAFHEACCKNGAKLALAIRSGKV